MAHNWLAHEYNQPHQGPSPGSAIPAHTCSQNQSPQLLAGHSQEADGAGHPKKRRDVGENGGSGSMGRRKQTGFLCGWQVCEGCDSLNWRVEEGELADALA